MTAFNTGTGHDVWRYVQLEMRELEDLHVVGHVRAIDHLRGPHGNVRAGALLTMLDSVGGITGGLASLPDGWVVSTNMSARTVALDHAGLDHAGLDHAGLDHAGPIRIDATVLRKGRNSVVTNVAVCDEGADGRLIMDGVLTSAILVPEAGPPVWPRPLRIEQSTPVADQQELRDWLGMRAVGPDVIEIPLKEGLRNPWGILHGGVVAALVDAAAEHATGGGVTTDVVLHYLAPNRVGPVRATANVVGRRSDGDVVRVEVCDEGTERVTAVAVAVAT
jgi:uncharacterized protein (TIGR00369 family)